MRPEQPASEPSASEPSGSQQQEQLPSVGGHYLLTVLGTNARAARYTLHGRAVEAPLAPLALLALLPPEQQPDKVVALCTPEARRESLPMLHEALAGRCCVEAVDVPSGHGQDDINTFLTKATAAIPEGSVRLSLDVTHGFRHFSFLTYLAGLYLVSLRNVELKGAWYGLLQRDDDSPFLDLRPLLELPRWIHALQVLRETGSALPLAKALQADVEVRLAADIARELGHISEAYLSALPLELGFQVRRFREGRLTKRKAFTRLLRDNHQLPLAAELLNRLDSLLLPFGLVASVQGQDWKARVPLTDQELMRQGRIIDNLLEREDDGMALGLLNEWTVSWALWCLDDTTDWLEHKGKRRHANSQLGALAAACQTPHLKKQLTPEQQSLGDYWHRLTSLRNGFHHHGMRPQVLVDDGKIRRELASIKTYWHHTLKALPRHSLQLAAGSTGVVLVTPIGNRPGVLFSALQAGRQHHGAEINTSLVICSSQSEARIHEAAARAQYRGELVPLVLEDPHGGIQEMERLREEAEPFLVAASVVQVNVTGGTTLMGLAAQLIAEHARGLAKPVHRFGLIDRRPLEQQEADPYQLGEPFWLTDNAPTDAGGSAD